MTELQLLGLRQESTHSPKTSPEVRMDQTGDGKAKADKQGNFSALAQPFKICHSLYTEALEGSSKCGWQFHEGLRSSHRNCFIRDLDRRSDDLEKFLFLSFCSAQ